MNLRKEGIPPTNRRSALVLMFSVELVKKLLHSSHGGCGGENRAFPVSPGRCSGLRGARREEHKSPAERRALAELGRWNLPKPH